MALSSSSTRRASRTPATDSAAAVDRERALLREEREDVVLQVEPERLLELVELLAELRRLLVSALQEPVEVLLEVAEREVEERTGGKRAVELGVVARCVHLLDVSYAAWTETPSSSAALENAT